MRIVKVLRETQGMGWAERAACTGMNPAVFYPKGGHTTYHLARATCARCTVAVECLAYAISVETEGLEAGMWGGLTPDERYAYRQARLHGGTKGRDRV